MHGIVSRNVLVLLVCSLNGTCHSCALILFLFFCIANMYWPIYWLSRAIEAEICHSFGYNMIVVQKKKCRLMVTKWMTSLSIHQFALTWCVFVNKLIFEIFWLMFDLRQIRFALAAQHRTAPHSTQTLLGMTLLGMMARPSHLIIDLHRYQQTVLHR